MFPAPLLLVILIVASPASLFFEGPMTGGVVAAVVALSIAIVALRIRPGEASFLSTVTRTATVIAIVPVLFMLIQILPLNFGLAHPIWESAAAALGRPIAGSISIDIGATLIALIRYLSIAGIAFVAAAVAIDRYRAAWILFALTLATTSISLVLLTARLVGFSAGGLGIGDAATDCAGLGVILAAAAALHTLERSSARAETQSDPDFWFRPVIAACFLAFMICCLTVFIGATAQAYFSVSCGLATLLIGIIIRRFSFGPWGVSAIILTALVVAIAALVIRPIDQNVGLLLAYATQAAAPMIAVTQRILTGMTFAGTGAGTFAAILPVYKDVNDLTVGSIPPTAVAAIAVEIGRPFLLAVLLATIALVVTLLRGASRRGRDSLYSIAGASCTVTITLLAFGNSGLFSTPVCVITAAIIGIAIAQSKSRSIPK